MLRFRSPQNEQHSSSSDCDTEETIHTAHSDNFLGPNHCSLSDRVSALSLDGIVGSRSQKLSSLNEEVSDYTNHSMPQYHQTMLNGHQKLSSPRTTSDKSPYPYSFKTTTSQSPNNHMAITPDRITSPPPTLKPSQTAYTHAPIARTTAHIPFLISSIEGSQSPSLSPTVSHSIKHPSSRRSSFGIGDVSISKPTSRSSSPCNMHFEARFKPNGKPFLDDLLAALKPLSATVNLYASPNGISLSFLCYYNQALISCYIDRESFESYHCKSSMLTIGVKVSAMSNYLKIAGDGDIVTIRAEEEQNGIAPIYELYLENSDRTRKILYEIDSLPSNDLPAVLPDSRYHAIFKIPSLEFQKICTALNNISDRVTINVKKTTVTFMASGPEGTLQIGLAQNKSTPSNQLHMVSFVTQLSQNFDLRLILKFTAATSLSTDVYLYMAPSQPLRIAYEFDSTKRPKGFIHYYIGGVDGDINGTGFGVASGSSLAETVARHH